MPCAAWTDIGDAWLTVFLGVGGDSPEDMFDIAVGLFGTARHKAGAPQSAFLSAGNAHTEEVYPFLLQLFRPAFRIGEVRVATIDDQVAFIKVREQLFDHRVDRQPGLHEQHYPARPLQRRSELLYRVGPDDILPARLAVDEPAGLAVGAVIDRYAEPVAFHVENEVLAHDTEAHQAELLGDPCFVVPAHVSILSVEERSRRRVNHPMRQRTVRRDHGGRQPFFRFVE